MNPDTMPSWLIDYLEENTGYKHKGMWVHDKQQPTVTDQSEAVIAFYEFISKPKNAAKLECVAKLIEVAKPCFSDLQKVLPCTDDEICKACKLEEALKPFQGGE